MRSVAARLTGLLLVLVALATSNPRPVEAKKVCNILCIQGFKCCIVRGEPTCVPIDTVCKR
jgi:hypothetical protein